MLGTLLTVVCASVSIPSIVVGLFPYTASSVQKWYHLRCNAPLKGEIGKFVEPTGNMSETTLYHVTRAMRRSKSSWVVDGDLVLVVDQIDGDAICMWQGQIISIPLVWLHRVNDI